MPPFVDYPVSHVTDPVVDTAEGTLRAAAVVGVGRVRTMNRNGAANAPRHRVAVHGAARQYGLHLHERLDKMHDHGPSMWLPMMKAGDYPGCHSRRY